MQYYAQILTKKADSVRPEKITQRPNYWKNEEKNMKIIAVRKTERLTLAGKVTN